MLFEKYSRITCILLKVWHLLYKSTFYLLTYLLTLLAACEIIASYNVCVGEYSAFASWHLASAS